MGTRGAYGFRINGGDKVTYCQFDSYPAGVGSSVLSFLKEVPDDELVRIANRIELVQKDGFPSQNQIALCKAAGTVNLSVSRRSENDWYCLLRETQGDLSIYRDSCIPFTPMIDNSEFLLDSLFCEWAYIINMDSNKLEVYEGFNKTGDQDKTGRFSSRAGRYAAKKPKDSEYYGVFLLDELPFGMARDMTDEQFVKHVHSLSRSS